MTGMLLWKVELAAIDEDMSRIVHMVHYYGSKYTAKVDVYHWRSMALVVRGDLLRVRRGPDHRLGETGITRLWRPSGPAPTWFVPVGHGVPHWVVGDHGTAVVDPTCNSDRFTTSRPGA